MKNKIVVVIMGQDCEKTIGMALESVKDADAVVYCDGGSTDTTIEKVKLFWYGEYEKDEKDVTIINYKFEQSNPFVISEQKNFCLDYLKENYKDYWCLYIDADEVVDDFSKFRNLINNHEWEDETVFSPRMKHFIHNIGLEDATRPIHHVPCRFFKVTDAKFYVKTEHTTLSSNKEGKIYNFDLGLIWHLGYIDGVWGVMKRYNGQMLRKEGNSHPVDFLNKWKDAHLFGQYPVKPIDPLTIPKIILENFGINKDELYFRDRGLEKKHFLDAIHWRDFFGCETAIDFGCGMGPRVYAMNSLGIDTSGLEINEYAVKNSMHPKVKCFDITQPMSIETDLAIAYDVLEHIAYEDLDKTINSLITATNTFILISVPFVGTPNCEADPTHIIKEDKDWWISQFVDKGLKLIPTPEHFLYREQVMIFSK